jgi:regulator of cell morphogenesis and NO signaling
MNTDIIIDVTKLQPNQKHPAIFDAFDTINPGQSVIIHNDHDPKPVYYQLLGMRGHCFSWSYLATGPEVWEVAIKKNNTDTNKVTVGQIVTKDIRKAEVFKKLGIDFCCGGKKTLEQACEEKGLRETDVLNELDKAVKQTNNLLDYEKWKLAFLADYIIHQHHGYVRESAPTIIELSEKVSAKHGDKNPELLIINDKVNELLKELSTHMRKEEAILFPYIKKLESRPCVDNGLESVQEAIWVMERDHDIAGELIHDIRNLSNNYTPPDTACNSYKLLMFKLEEFENDLLKHVHLENNILFPKAIAMEKDV